MHGVGDGNKCNVSNGTGDPGHPAFSGLCAAAGHIGAGAISVARGTRDGASGQASLGGPSSSSFRCHSPGRWYDPLGGAAESDSGGGTFRAHSPGTNGTHDTAGGAAEPNPTRAVRRAPRVGASGAGAGSAGGAHDPLGGAAAANSRSGAFRARYATGASLRDSAPAPRNDAADVPRAPSGACGPTDPGDAYASGSSPGKCGCVPWRATA